MSAKQRLPILFAELARNIGWDIGKDSTAPIRVGNTRLTHQTYAGWAIEQVTNTAGGVRMIHEACPAAELDTWLTGALYVFRELDHDNRFRRRVAERFPATVDYGDSSQ